MVSMPVDCDALLMELFLLCKLAKWLNDILYSLQYFSSSFMVQRLGCHLRNFLKAYKVYYSISLSNYSWTILLDWITMTSSSSLYCCLRFLLIKISKFVLSITQKWKKWFGPGLCFIIPRQVFWRCWIIRSISDSSLLFSPLFVNYNWYHFWGLFRAWDHVWEVWRPFLLRNIHLA